MTGGEQAEQARRQAQRLRQDARQMRAQARTLHSRTREVTSQALAVLARVRTPRAAPGHAATGDGPGGTITSWQAARIREITVIRERDRLADDLNDKVIQKAFAAGITLHHAAGLSVQPEVRAYVGAALGELDELIRALRDAVFNLDQHPARRGLRAEVLRLSSQLARPPELSFSGPVDTVSPPAAGQLGGILRQALALISEYATPSRIDVTAGEGSLVTVVEAAPLSVTAEATGRDCGLASLQAASAQAGIRMQVRSAADVTRFSWHLPMSG